MRKFVTLLLIVLLSAVFSYCVIGKEEFDYKSIKKVAVYPFEGPYNYAGAVADQFTTNLVSMKMFTVVERHRVRRILEEQKLSLSGIIDESDIKKIGELLGVDAIFCGSISMSETLGTRYDPILDIVVPCMYYYSTASARAIDVETGSVIWSSSYHSSSRISATDANVLATNKVLDSLFNSWAGKSRFLMRTVPNL